MHSASLYVSSHGTKLKAWLAVVTGKLKEKSDYFLTTVDSGSGSDFFSFSVYPYLEPRQNQEKRLKFHNC